MGRRMFLIQYMNNVEFPDLYSLGYCIHGKPRLQYYSAIINEIFSVSILDFVQYW